MSFGEMNRLIIVNVVILNSAGSEAKKPKWNEFKQKKKELKQNRQQNEKKETYHIVSRAKQVWEIVRRWAVLHYSSSPLYHRSWVIWGTLNAQKYW